MFGLHLGGKGERIVAVADIGSGSAALAIASVSSGAPIRVLIAERVGLKIEERTKEATIAALGEELAQVGEKVTKAYAAGGTVKPVQEVYCVIRPPWSHSMGARVHKELDTPKVVTEAMVTELAKQALAEVAEVDRNNLLEANIMRIELNGYPTSEPEKKTAHEISLFALVSDYDASLRAAALVALQKVFPHLTPVFRSAIRSLLTVLQQELGIGEDLILVDIGNEATTLTTLHGGVIAQQGAIPEGVRTIIKRLAPTGMPEETLSLVRMLGRDQCSGAACDTLKEAMVKAEPELVRVFGEGMASSAEGKRLPNRLLLMAQPDLLPWLTKFFGRIDFTQFTQTTQPFVVETLGLPELSTFATADEKVALDARLALSVTVVNTNTDAP